VIYFGKHFVYVYLIIKLIHYVVSVSSEQDKDYRQSQHKFLLKNVLLCSFMQEGPLSRFKSMFVCWMVLLKGNALRTLPWKNEKWQE